MRLAIAVAVAAGTGILAGPAAASDLIGRTPFAAARAHYSLKVNRKGEALITFRQRRGWRHVLAWGAVDGRTPNPVRRQVKFRADYAGGWLKYRNGKYWQKFRSYCRPYDGPKLDWVVASCKGPDGSYWAVQAWQTNLPDLGYFPWLGSQSIYWVHLSHWTAKAGIAKIEAWSDWAYSGRVHEVFGRATYRGKPIFGYRSTRAGAPLDPYGRLIFLDTFNSAYSKGWRRENSFLLHGPRYGAPGGNFCYGFFPRNPYKYGYAHPPGAPNRDRPAGNGRAYRMTMIGPGVSPDVTWTGPGLHDFNRNNPEDVAYQQQMRAIRRQVVQGDKFCT
jgi:hypothetical protein